MNKAEIPYHFRSFRFTFLESKENFLKLFQNIYGKTAMCSVVGIERIFRGFGKFPHKQYVTHFGKRVPFSYACCETYHIIKQGKEWKGNEKSRTGIS